MPIERAIRAGLPLVRWMQTRIPLPLARPLIKRSLTRVRLATGVVRQPVSADGVPCEWIIPQGCRLDRVLLYLHGGGFVFGLTAPHIRMAAHLAAVIGLRVLMVDYRLAPDYPFPAALDDCASAYHWLLRQQIRPSDIVIAGDSAGGNLAITTAMRLRDSGNPLPAALACLSPVTDLTARDNRREGFRDPLLPPEMVSFYSRSYVGHGDASNPLISPVRGDLRGLPPLLVHVGEDETLLEDATRLAAVARAAGVDVRLEVYPRMWHVWQLWLALPQAVGSLDDIARFLHSHLGHSRQEPASV